MTRIIPIMSFIRIRGIRTKTPGRLDFGGPGGPQGPKTPFIGLPRPILQTCNFSGICQNGSLGKFATDSFVDSTEFPGRPVEIPPELAYY